MNTSNFSKNPDLITIVLTGGPGAGKTKSLKALQSHLQQQGYQVYAMAETATELINGGISPVSCNSVQEFQDLLFGLQLAKEETYKKAARLKGAKENNKSILLLDRGLIDNHSYLSDKEFDEILSHYQTNEKEILKRYDLVFHLESAARGNPDWYSTDNNEARFEAADQAIAVDERTGAAWVGHPHLYTISAKPECSEKIEELIETVDTLLHKKG